MGYSAQVQQSPNQQSGKGSAPAAPYNPPQAGMVQGPAPTDGVSGQTPQPMGKGGNYQSNATSGQPQMGAPNAYPNTVGQWDNTQQQLPKAGSGKGKA